jgi:uncharacterized membrane protein
MSNPTDASIFRDQLPRLIRLTDVVYAVALVFIIEWLPLPSESVNQGESLTLLQLFAEHSRNMIAELIGLLFVIIYWLRSNTLLAPLDRTDGMHTGFSIVSVFFVLVLLYSVRIGDDLAPNSRRATESLVVGLIGLAAAVAWWRARKKGLTRPGMTPKETTDLQIEAFAEPLTALITLPVAFVGELAWNLAWLAYIPIAALVRRRSHRAAP